MAALIKSTFENIRIGGIACVVPSTRDILIEKYAHVFGKESVQRFSKMTGVISRHASIQEQTASDLSYEATRILIKYKDI